MLNKILVIACDQASVSELTSGAKALAEEVVLISPADNCGCADRVLRFSSDVSVVSALSAIVSAAEEENAPLVLCDSSRDGKLAAGYVSGALGKSPLCDASSLLCEADYVEITRLVHGGGAVKTERSSYPAVVTVPAGSYEPAAENPSAEIRVLSAEDDRLSLESTAAIEAVTVNLASAKRVVGAGRGLSSADNLPVLEQIAAKLGAEVGCTRPVAEEEHWYPKARYIGVSGCMLKPNFYLAVGISGQIQHMVGVNQAGVIFAIDKNENAPIASQADYTLVGDVNTVLPALLERLS